MQVVLDPEVMAAAAFLQREVPAARLVAVSKALAEIAPLLWGHYQGEGVHALRLCHDPISACEPRTQLGATG